MPLPRPTVNLDALGELLDKALEHPIARAVGALSPGLEARARAVREHLPDVAGRVAEKVQDRAIGAITQEARELEAEALDAIDRFLGKALAKSKTPKTKRLKAPKRKR
jgi:hypothetical protein